VEIRKAELGELQSLMKKEQLELYHEEEAKGIVRGLFSYLTGLNASQMVLEKEKKLSESEIHFLQHSLKRLKQHEPLQYITGRAYFHDLEFKVNPSVLIPRPETEELVEWIFNRHKGTDKIKLLDIGTGSGCIAISLKKKIPELDVFAIDVSEEALEVARDNAASLDAELSFELLDILDVRARRSMPHFDIIVSNPPYVIPADKEKMLPNVSEHEPDLALFVENDPLVFYKEIIAFSKDHLSAGGSLFFECNEGNATEVEELLLQGGFQNIELRKDMQGKDRMVSGTTGTRY